MKEISVHLLGNPEIWSGDTKIRFPYKKAEAFFYYLCVKKRVSREEVICLLWGEEEETVGKKKLRDAVYQVKRLLGKEVLLTWGHTGIGLNPDVSVKTDWDRKFGQEELSDNEVFLDHFYIKNCYEFEAWTEKMRRTLAQRQREKAEEKLKEAAAGGDLALLQKYGNFLLDNDPYNEELYFEIMSLYAQNGNYTMALRLYGDLQKTLAGELGEKPCEELTDLFHRIYTIKETVRTEGVMAQSPFVGRKKELYRLSCFLDGALNGQRRGSERQPACLAVSGEGGSGKTAFLEQGARLAAGNGIAVLKSACCRQGEEFYLSPWNDIFCQLSQLSEAYGRKRTESKESKEDFSRMTYSAVEKKTLDLFEFLAAKTGVLLVFDDIQWMDSMSCQLLNRLMLCLSGKRLLLLCSLSREEESKAMRALEPVFLRGQAEIMRLSPFTREETDQLIRIYLPKLAPDEEKKAEIYRATDGNAFFLKELLNLIREKGYTLEKSTRTNYVIQARLSGLSFEERETLGAISVFPEKAGIEELELLLPKTDRLSLLGILESLQERFLIREVLTGWKVHYQFVHRAFQEYILERQSRGKRMTYHQILARHYEKAAAENGRTALIPLVIYHYEGCHDRIKACQYRIRWLKEYYTLINENFPVLHWSLSDLDESFRAAPPADEMLRLAGELAKMEENTEEIRRMKMEMDYIRGRYDIARGDYSFGLSCIEEGMRLAGELSDERMLLACCRQKIFYGIQTGDLETVEEYTGRGLLLAGRRMSRDCRLAAEEWIENESGEFPGEEPLPFFGKQAKAKERESWEEYAAFLRLRGWYFLHTGRYERGERMLYGASCIFRGLGREYAAGRAACLNYIGDGYRMRGDPEKAFYFYKEAVSVAEKEPVIIGLGQFYANAGQALYLAGNRREAGKYLHRAEEHLQKNGCIWGLERTEACLALLCLDEGDEEKAGEHYQRGRELSAKIRNPGTEKLLETVSARLSELHCGTKGGIDGRSL